MPERKIMSRIRRWSRAVHRDLSFFFGGIVLIYAISGFTLNHKHDFNAEYAIRQHRFRTEGTFPKSEHDYTKNYVLSILEPLGYESVKKRPLLSVMNRLHYNPGRWWTVFSDVFAGSLVLITLTGLVMVHGGKGLWGRGGIELVAGILFPLLFIVFS